MSYPGVPWVIPPLECADAIDPSVDQDEVADVASEILFVLSGRQFGVATQTVRPRSLRPSCPSRACLGGDGGFPERGGSCGGRTRSIRDGIGVPIVGVTELWVDGALLPAGSYRVTPDAIIRTDGGAFPCCQDPDSPRTEAGTLEVTYTWGKQIPDSGVLAAREFACQLALAAAPATAGKCRLPARVQTISRQGVTMALLDPQTFLDEGRTGLYLVDLFLGAFNPGRGRRRARVFSPDVPYTAS